VAVADLFQILADRIADRIKTISCETGSLIPSRPSRSADGGRGRFFKGWLAGIVSKLRGQKRCARCPTSLFQDDNSFDRVAGTG
jgi:hypothetical protein